MLLRLTKEINNVLRQSKMTKKHFGYIAFSPDEYLGSISVFKTQSNIQDGAFLQKLFKKLHGRCWKWFQKPL